MTFGPMLSDLLLPLQHLLLLLLLVRSLLLGTAWMAGPIAQTLHRLIDLSL